MDKNDIFLPRPINTILKGNKNYLSWSQVMRSFLKDRMLLHYCTGAITIPVKGASEEDAAFLGCMIEWDSHNHMILIWIQNTSIPSISNLLGSFDDAKSTWDMLAKRYSTTHGSMKYQLVVELHQLRQKPGPSMTTMINFASFGTKLTFLIQLGHAQWMLNNMLPLEMNFAYMNS